MEAAASKPNEIPNEGNALDASNNPVPEEDSQCSEKVLKSSENVAKPKRVSFHFGSNTSDNSNDVILNTIQNIYDDSKTESNENANLIRNNSFQSRIDKSAYAKLHRHSFSSTGNSSVDKLKGRYEYIAKQQTDNNLKANTIIRTKTNSDKTCADDIKNSFFESEKQTGNSKNAKENDQNLKSTPTTSENKETLKSAENSLQKTTSNIERLQNNLSTKLSSDTIEKLRSKYSPASYGYPRDIYSRIPKKVQFVEKEQTNKVPVPTPRKSATPSSSQNKDFEEPNKKEIQSVTAKLVSVPDPIPEKNDSAQILNPIKDENSNNIGPSTSSQKQALPVKPKLPEKITEDISQSDTSGIEIEVTYDKIEFAEPEDKHFIERHSSSEDSVDKLESFFSEIVMDKKPKEKKRSNSFRKILTGGFFGRDKKKPEDEKNKNKKKDNTVFADNAQNESQAFDRNSSHRHTIDNSFPRRDYRGNNASVNHQPDRSPLYYYSPPPQPPRQPSKTRDDSSLRNRYTEMKGSFKPNNNSACSPEDYVPMDNNTFSKMEPHHRTYMNVNKYMDTSSSSSNTLDSENRNCTYQNALIAQAEMRQLRENENLQRTNVQRSFIPMVKRNPSTPQENRYVNVSNRSNSPEIFRDVPQNTSQNLQLVKPKALIPINSERPLPNPYHNNQDNQHNQDRVDNSRNNYSNYEDKTLNRNLNVDILKSYPQKIYAKTNSAVVVEEIYGTVFDSITPPKSTQANMNNLRLRSLSPELSGSNSNRSSPICKSPSSPRSLEASKLRLPPNREKVDLQPRIKSPIPQAKISTDKIIATELLRNKTSPVLSERSTPKLHKSPFASPTRPTTHKESNAYENSPDSFQNKSPNGHSTPQSASQSNSDYVCLRKKPPISPKEDCNVNRYSPSVTECLEAAEWQRKQRELDKSPALENPQQITTNVVVHVNPEDELVLKNSYPSPSPTLRQKSPIISTYGYLQEYQQPQVSPRSATAFHNGNRRPHTPLQQPIPSPNSKSPEKQQILHNVEAFYWRELRKLKDKEELDLLRYRQQQLHVYGYVEDPVLSRRSRSNSPSVQRGRRSLSLPRDSRPLQNVSGRVTYSGQEVIPEGKPIIARQPIQLPTESTYGQVRQPLQRNPNFIRNTFERSTIGPVGTGRNPQPYETYYPTKQGYPPIFKRGSLTGQAAGFDSQAQASKKVSFSSPQNPSSSQGWPTKNGFTRSPPTRRIEREIGGDDEVFLPNTPRTPQSRTGNSEDAYGYYSNLPHHYANQNAIYGTRPPRSEGVQEGIYGRAGTKQITVSNKVCDIYGQIHETNQRTPTSPRKSNLPPNTMPQNYGQIKQVGYMYGQVQPHPSQQQLQTSPNPVLGRSFNHLGSPQQNSFVRGTRLTASVNDMYRRYPNERMRYEVDPRYQKNVTYSTNEKVMDVPNRPLPPLPEGKNSRGGPVKKNIGAGYVPVSDTESGSEAGEVQRILQSGVRQKNFSVIGGSRGENEGEIKSSRSRSARREDPRRHTLSGDQHYTMAGQGGPLSRTMDLEGQFPRGYPPSTNAMLFDDDPGIMSEVETSSTGFRRGGKQRSSLPVVRTPSKTLERPLGLVFLQYRNETKRALLPNEITSIDTVKALFVRSFPKQLSMEYLDSPLVKIYIHDSSKDMFYELEDVRSHLREIRDRSVLRLFESTDVSGGLPMGGVGIPGGIGHFEDPSYFSEPEFDSEYQHQHIHKSKGSAGKSAPYYMGSTTSLPRGGPLLRPYSPAVGSLPPDRMKTLPAGAPPKPQRAYSSGATRASDGSSRPPDRFAPFQRPANPLFNLPDGYMSSPERGSRGYEDPYYSQYTSRSGSITPVIDEEVSDTELLDEQYSLYGVKLGSSGPRRSQFPGPAAPPYDATRLRVEHMERQLANLTGLVQKALTQTPTPRDFLAPPGRDAYRSEKDRLKPAPPPKPASLSPGQYDGRHIYRDLQLTPEMYNQLRGLQKKAKDLRAEVRNLRRMSQAQAHSVRETIRDTFIKIRAMLMAGGEQVWQAGMDQERVRLSRDEDLYKQEMLRLEKDLTDLEASVEELRGNVINRKTRVNMSDVENMALVLSKSSKTVADLKLRFPGLQDSLKAFLSSEMDKVVREEKFLKEEPERLESALRRCKKLTGTLVTLKRLASVQEQRLPCSTGATDGNISPSLTETPPITPTSGQHSKPPSGARVGQVSFGGDGANTTDSNQRPENALDALLDELQTFSKPHPATVNTQMPQASYSDSTPSDPPAIPVKGIPPSHSAHFGYPSMSEIGRKGSMDSASILPTQNLTVSTATGSLRRLHSYPSGSDTDNSPPIQPLRTQLDGKSFNKPPIPERNAELLQHITSGRRVPPPPPPRTSSKSPLASPTSPSLPPRSPATGLQHIQNVQNMTEKPQSQFEAATQNLGLSTLRRNVPNRSSIKDNNKAQTLPRNIGSNLQVHTQTTATAGGELQNVSSSSCESVNSQDGTKKGSRKEELEQRHQELLKKQKALQEQYARLQQLQRGNNTLAVVPPAPDQLLKKTGSESNLLQKMGLQMATTQMTGSLTHLPSTTNSSTNTASNTTNTITISTNPINTSTGTTAATDTATDNSTSSSTTTTSKVYETDIL